MSATAGGFQSGPQSARLLGLGGASTAYTRDIAVMYYNPGAIGHLDSLIHVSVGGMGTARLSSFVGTDSRRQTRQELEPQPSGYLYAAARVAPKVSVGLSINQPFGYQTTWPSDWEGRSVVQESSLTTVYVQPTVAYQINDNFSVGAGFIYAYGDLRQQRALGQYDDRSAQARFEGSGSGYGANIGLYGRTADDLSFGISFRTPVTLKVGNGQAAYSGVLERDATLYPASMGFRTDIELPSTLSVGLADRMTKNLLVTFDFNLTSWSRYDSLNFEMDNATRVTAGRRYEDAMSFRVGAEYTATPILTLRAGVSYDETPVRDEYINADLPDANLLGGSLGLTLAIKPNLLLDMGYSYSQGGERRARVNISRDVVSSIDGSYRTAVHTAAVGLSYSFGGRATRAGQ
ncbi:outer membrane protein transport protein [Microvirga sp. STR05]|uniref:Outer membrane protein transport protein n=1 Tax=Hymenobacter duratus TaxID=2771356 RepID=A0ABR8JFE6_9BACT|nr:outer membrane protein transport protein [Hymenobacter duratus]MBD2714792.1 outer membrane protein transport protein [Hymenobacter duratus]MBR7949697.1 outer membrane protein transport protein [Microvirga sp. STR05]